MNVLHKSHKFYTIADFTKGEIARRNKLAMAVAVGGKICKQCGEDVLQRLVFHCSAANNSIGGTHPACRYVANGTNMGTVNTANICSNPYNKTSHCSFKLCPLITRSGD